MSAVLGGGIYGTESAFGSVWVGLDADRLRLYDGTQPCQRCTLPHPGSSGACESGSFQSEAARTNHRRFSKAWPNIEEEGRGAGGRETLLINNNIRQK